MNSAELREKEREALETPVVLIVFNRPAHTRMVFERVAAARPRRLLVIADGARPGKPGEQERCDEVRRIVSRVNWPCEVSTEYAARNLGCRTRIVTGLQWVFERVEEAIILEDDVLPDPSFFPFCTEMLARFREERRVGMITGFNIGSDVARTPYSYYFSRLTHIWGWATWRRAWETYDEEMSCWPTVREGAAFHRAFPTSDGRRYWRYVLDKLYRGMGPNTWDYQWMVTNLFHERLAVAPQTNLVENIGFGAGATHVVNTGEAPSVKAGSLHFPLQHPPDLRACVELDILDQELSAWQRPALPIRVQRKLRRLLSEQLRQAA